MKSTRLPLGILTLGGQVTRASDRHPGLPRHTSELKVRICNASGHRVDQSWGRLAACSTISQHHPTSHPTSIQHPSNITSNIPLFLIKNNKKSY